MSAADFCAAERECDLVMKGGITSGVVYPTATIEIAKRFQLRNIGGTSVGAIVAAAVAGAEYARANGDCAGFCRLETMSTDLAKPGFMLSLFQPDTHGRALYEIITSVMRERGWWSKANAALRTAADHYRTFAAWGVAASLVLTLPGLVSALSLVETTDGSIMSFVALLLTVLLALLGWRVGSTLGCLLGAVCDVRGLPRHGYGLCPGKTTREEADGRKPPEGLMDWLAGLVENCAGINRPLTLGDLWTAGTCPLPELGQKLLAEAEGNPELRRINLQFMTTALSLGRPFTIPFDEPIWYFCASDMNLLFSESIVKALETAGAELGPRLCGTVRADRFEPGDTGTDYLYRFPTAGLPVVVAARLSMSFPVLFKAVPLYRHETREDGVGKGYWKVWMSDGGLTSNFPVHFFDAAIPTRPTFGINLRYTGQPVAAHNRDMVWMPRTLEEGRGNAYSAFGRATSEPCLTAFGDAILDTMQNWRDNVQLAVPGYRDRVIHISLAEGEGGMNLQMSDFKIQTLLARGKLAGEHIAEAYRVSPPGAVVTWENHWWTRYRSFLSLLEDWLNHCCTSIKRFGNHTGLEVPDNQFPVIAFIGRSGTDAPTSYPFSSEQREHAIHRTLHLLEALQEWKGRASFKDNRPEPHPQIRITPRI